MSKVINAGNNYLNKFQVINVVFKERKDDFILEKLLVLALFGSLDQQPCTFSEWSISTYEAKFNWIRIQTKFLIWIEFRPRRGRWRFWVKVPFRYHFDLLMCCFAYSWSQEIFTECLQCVRWQASIWGYSHIQNSTDQTQLGPIPLLPKFSLRCLCAEHWSSFFSAYLSTKQRWNEVRGQKQVSCCATIRQFLTPVSSLCMAILAALQVPHHWDDRAKHLQVLLFCKGKYFF